MTDVFKASNGIVISTGAGSQRGGAGFSHSNTLGTLVGGLSKLQLDAFREFFLHERDQELGRWRSSADPLFVGHAMNSGRVKLVNEATGSCEFYSRRQAGNFPADEFSAVAEEYFDAHPLSKPWHDAKPGEVWLFSWGYDEDVARLEPSGQWRKFDGKAISSGDLSFVQEAGCLHPCN